MIIAATILKYLAFALAAAAFGLFCELVREHTEVGSGIDQEAADE